MTFKEIAVIVFGLFAGYWVVGKLFFRSPRIENQSSPMQAPIPPPPSWYDILEIAPSASAPEIRNAYKHLIAKYHPDKVDSLGQELKDLAGKKSQEITAAYRDGMHARGEQP
jgi:preprotein translocase subunit Sec63